MKTHQVRLEGEENSYDIYLEPRPGKEHKFTLIFLRDAGQSAFELYQMLTKQLETLFGNFNNINDDIFQFCKIVIPNKLGNIDELVSHYQQDQLLKAVSHLDEIYQKELLEVPGMESFRMFIGGYSVGCSIAMAYLLKYRAKTPLGGVFGLNGY